MPKRPRIPKSPERRLADCESQLRFLAEALDKQPHERDRYKQVAGALRILVCSAGRNRPLLLDLLKTYGLASDVLPQPPTFGPVAMVGDIAKYGSLDLSTMSDAELEDLAARERARAKPVPLASFVEAGLAVYIDPYEISYKDLILTVAQQSGTAHEDDHLDAAIVELERILIGGYSGHEAPLRGLGMIVLSAGRELIRHVATHHGYRPHTFMA